MWSLTYDKITLTPNTVTTDMLKIVAHKSLRVFERFWENRVIGVEYDILREAVEGNNLDIVKYSSLVSVNKQDDMGVTVLHLACKNLNYNIIEYLLQNKADPNILSHKGLSPLNTVSDSVRYYERDCFSRKTCHKLQLQIIPLLIRYNGIVSKIHDICDLDLAMCFHTNGIPIVSTEIYDAYQGIVPDDFKINDLFNKEHKYRFTPLLVYAEKHEEIAINLINRYWDEIPTYLKKFLFIEAVQNSKVRLVNLLLTKNMDPNMKLDQEYYPPDLLCIAIRRYEKGHDRYGHVLLALLDSGAIIKKHHYDMRTDDIVLDYLENFDLKV